MTGFYKQKLVSICTGPLRGLYVMISHSDKLFPALGFGAKISGVVSDYLCAHNLHTMQSKSVVKQDILCARNCEPIAMNINPTL